MSAPKDGDRVRVTVEGHVSNGRVRSDDGTLLCQDVDWAARFGSIEVLPPPVPSWANTPYAVVLDGNGRAWQRAVADQWNIAHSTFASMRYVHLARTYGPLTLLHDPITGS